MLPEGNAARYEIRRIAAKARKFLRSLSPAAREEALDILRRSPKPFPDDPEGHRKGHMKGTRECVWHLRNVGGGNRSLFYAIQEDEGTIDLLIGGQHDIYDQEK
jgi:hypothetical protein